MIPRTYKRKLKASLSSENYIDFQLLNHSTFYWKHVISDPWFSLYGWDTFQLVREETLQTSCPRLKGRLIFSGSNEGLHCLFVFMSIVLCNCVDVGEVEERGDGRREGGGSYWTKKYCIFWGVFVMVLFWMKWVDHRRWSHWFFLCWGKRGRCWVSWFGFLLNVCLLNPLSAFYLTHFLKRRITCPLLLLIFFYIAGLVVTSCFNTGSGTVRVILKGFKGLWSRSLKLLSRPTYDQSFPLTLLPIHICDKRKSFRKCGSKNGSNWCLLAIGPNRWYAQYRRHGNRGKTPEAFFLGR